MENRINHRIVTSVVALLLIGGTASASLIVNGDFEDTAKSNDNGVTDAYLNLGWVYKGNDVGSNTGWDWFGGVTGTNLGAAYDTSSAANRYAFGQANEITSETGSSYNLKFDWTQSGTDALFYQVVAYNVGTDSDGTKQMPGALNFYTAGVQLLGTNANGADWIDLLDGTVKTSNGAASIGTSTATGTGQTVALNFGGGAIENYDRIAIKLWSSTAGDSTDGLGTGGVLDNIGIVVPEPSTLSLVGLFGVLGLVARRCRM